MKRTKITYVGEELYGGNDHGDVLIADRRAGDGRLIPGITRSVDLEPGQSAWVSEQKAAQLLADRPDVFEFGETLEMSDEEYQAASGMGTPSSDVEPEPEPASPDDDDDDDDEPAEEPETASAGASIPRRRAPRRKSA